MIYFESPRLKFRDWKYIDLEKFKIINKDKEVMKFFPSILSVDETEKFYEVIQEEFEQYGYGLFAVEDKENGEFVGFIGFHWARFDSKFTPCIEIGWRLDKNAWGKGFATEGAKACLNYGFGILGFGRIYSFTSKINIKSEKVMKKIGLVKLDEFDHPKLDKCSNLLRHVLYCITLNDYLKAQESSSK